MTDRERAEQRYLETRVVLGKAKSKQIRRYHELVRLARKDRKEVGK